MILYSECTLNFILISESAIFALKEFYYLLYEMKNEWKYEISLWTHNWSTLVVMLCIIQIGHIKVWCGFSNVFEILLNVV